MSDAAVTPRIVEFGTGYACRYGGWALARAGCDVVRATMDESAPTDDRLAWLDDGKVSDSGDLAGLLAGADACLTDVNGLLDTATPRPAALRHLNVVELGAPAADPNANRIIGDLSGVNAAIGDSDGPALVTPGRMLEAIVGIHAGVAALAAIVGSSRDGVGEQIRVDPVDCVAGIAGVNAMQYLNYGLRWFRAGRSAFRSGGPFPNRLMHAADGWVAVISRSGAEWDALLDMIGRPSWADDPRFADQITIAHDHADEVTGLLEEAFAHLTVAELTARAKEFRVPLAPVRTVADVIEDQRLISRDGESVVPVAAIDAVTVSSAAPVRVRPVDRSAPVAPLSGLRVLDLGWVWAAPIVSAWLADLGAEVVRVESLDRLDISRRRGIEFPVAGAPDDLAPYERAHLFHAVNRNKSSVALDLKDGEERRIFEALVAEADVVVESFSAGVLERLGLGPAALMAINPSLLLLSMGGATVDGEIVSRSYAPILSSLAGVEASVVDSEGEPLGMLNWGAADVSGGTWGLLAVVHALARGEGGQHLKVSQLRGIVNTCAPLFLGGDALSDDGGDSSIEVGGAHLAGCAGDELGAVYRRILVRSWDPRSGERSSFGPPWQFRRRPVAVRMGAPLLGDTDAAELLLRWQTTSVEEKAS